MVCAIRKARVLSILFVVVLLAVAEIAEAQQPKKVPRIGFVAMTSSAGGGQNLEAFRRGLRDLGYVEGDNISMEPRWADGWAERVPGLISELIHLKVDIIVISSATGALAAKKATSTIPVVFAAVTDPFEHGLVEPRKSAPPGDLARLRSPRSITTRGSRRTGNPRPSR